MPKQKKRSRSRKHGNQSPRSHLSPDDRILLTVAETHYSRFDLEGFQQRRRHFEALDLGDPMVDVPPEVRHVLAAEDGQTLARSISWDSWQPGQSHLWRARRIDRNKALLGYWTDDLWEPPSQVASAGRFNHKGESLFYACIGDESLAPWVAIREARIGAGDIFILMKYAIVDEFRLTRIGVPNQLPGMRSKYRAIERTVSQFIVDTIRMPASVDRGPDTYRFTRAVLRDLFPLRDGLEVGWSYESVQVPGGANVALPPSTARRLLDLRGMAVGRMAYDHGGLNLGIEVRDWTANCAPRGNDGHIGFDTFKPARSDAKLFSVLPD